VLAMRAAAKQPIQIGMAPVGVVSLPATNRPEDVEAARQEMFAVHDRNTFNNSWWMDPLILGKYPEDGLHIFESDFPVISYHDLDIIKQPLDFYGVNIYGSNYFRRGTDGRPEALPLAEGFPLTANKWVVTAEGLYWGPRFLWERYKLPIIITENGMSGTDWVHLDGKVHDPQRIDLTTRYLRELRRAAADGVDVRGYFHWSFMDNFEWSEGYKERFGLVYVDYQTQARIPKDSAAWYRGVIETNGASL
jgi:beta-glucosidase